VDPRRDPRPGAGSPLGARRPLARRLRRRLRPPRTLRPTRAGWLFFALTFGVGFAAMNTGNNLLYMVLALLLAFLVLSGVLSESALRGIRVTRRLPPEIHAEAPARVMLEIHNDQRLIPSYAVVVEDLLGEDLERARPAGRVFAFRIGPGERAARPYRLRPEARGLLAFAGFRVVTRFPFGLFSKAMRIEAPAQVLVYPAVDALRVGQPGASAAAGASDPGGMGGRESAEASGLRPYAPGDPLRHIHWRASLRRSALLVRDRERERDGEVEVRLRTRDPVSAEGFERAVRRAASELVAHLAAGWRVGLRTEERRFAPTGGASQRRRLLAFLARVAPAPDEARRGRPARDSRSGPRDTVAEARG
jgi:uncharacterized protein (DUF58 family)